MREPKGMHRFERAREFRMHALVGRGIRGQSFLGIPGKVTFDNKILDRIPMKTQGDMGIEHGNARMRFDNAYV